MSPKSVRRCVILIPPALALLLLAALALATHRSASVRAQDNSVCQANPGPPDAADPSIVVAAPAAGDRVSNPVAVSGMARVFEATVSLSLKGADGSAIADGTVQSEEAAPVLSPFSGTLPFTVTANTPACLWVFEASARDGSPVNVVQVPVTLLARAGGIASSAPPPASSSAAPAATSAPAATDTATAAPTASPAPAASATATSTPVAAAAPTASASPAATPRAGATPAPGRQVAGTPLRQVNWASVLANDPYLSAAGGCLPPPGAALPCVTILLSHPQSAGGPGGGATEDQITGLADIAPGRVLYGDIDGDGADEAVISIESGGTAGALGLLVYHQASPAPQIVDVIPGYKLGASINSGTLTVTEPFYFGFEANCCPTGLVQTSFVQSGDNLQVTAGPSFLSAGQDSHPLTAAELTVLGFYHAIDAGSYQDAYNLTSAAYQAANPYADWKAGYVTTKGVAVETQPGTGDPNTVLVNVTVQEQTDAGTATRMFSGSWFLIPDTTAPTGLLLDHATISEVSSGQ